MFLWKHFATSLGPGSCPGRRFQDCWLSRRWLTATLSVRFFEGVQEDGAETSEVSAARSALREVTVLRDIGVVDGLTPFECFVLDKLEGVISGDLFESPRYADDQDLQVLFELAGLEVLVLESNDVLASQAASR